MKLYYFLTILVGLMILMNLAGINTSSGYLLTYFGVMHPEEFQSSELYTVILAIFIAAVVAGVVIGFFLFIGAAIIEVFITIWAFKKYGGCPIMDKQKPVKSI